MRRPLFALLLLASAPALAGDYATCILDKMPGVANDVAVGSVLKLCRSEYPGGMDAVTPGSGRRFFSHDSGDECTLKKAKDTRSQRAAIIIGNACRRLYDKVRYYTDEELGILPERR